MATSMLAVTGPHVQGVFLLAVVRRRDQTADEASVVIVVLIEQLVVVRQPVQIVVFRRRGNGCQCATVAQVGLAVIACCRSGSGLSRCFRQHQRPARRMRIEEKPRVRRLVNIGDGRWQRMLRRRRSRRSRRIVGGCFAASAENIGDGERSQIFPTEIHFFIGIHFLSVTLFPVRIWFLCFGVQRRKN